MTEHIPLAFLFLPFIGVAVFYAELTYVIDRRYLEGAVIQKGFWKHVDLTQPVLYLMASWLLVIPFPQPVIGVELPLLYSLSYYTFAAGVGTGWWKVIRSIIERKTGAKQRRAGPDSNPPPNGNET